MWEIKGAGGMGRTKILQLVQEVSTGFRPSLHVVEHVRGGGENKGEGGLDRTNIYHESNAPNCDKPNIDYLPSLGLSITTPPSFF